VVPAVDTSTTRAVPPLSGACSHSRGRYLRYPRRV